jgi:hypothetical protein
VTGQPLCGYVPKERADGPYPGRDMKFIGGAGKLRAVGAEKDLENDPPKPPPPKPLAPNPPPEKPPA